MNKISQALSVFEPISLSEMEEVKLLNRVDSKYIFHENMLPELLSELALDYRILEIAEKRTHGYESLYFDTTDYQLYYSHHNGKTNRLKIRFRRYVDTDLTFFEIKQKTRANRTVKFRTLKANLSHQLSDDDYQQLTNQAIDLLDLHSQLWIYFDRITLVSKNLTERLTLDLNLTYRKNNYQESMHKLVVAEIKQDKGSVFSPMIQSLKKRYVAQSSFSKYSVGIAKIETVKNNAFKPILLKMNKVLAHD